MGSLPTVFSSSGGDGPNYHAICETLASDDKKISPTRFHNSVHNAPSGYWSIATRDMASSNVLCAHDASFGAGLLDALSQILCDNATVMLVAYESDYPEPLRTVRPIPDAFGLALILSPEPSAHALACIDVELTDVRHDTLAHAQLESLRSAVPSARGLPLLAALAATIDLTPAIGSAALSELTSNVASAAPSDVLTDVASGAARAGHAEQAARANHVATHDCVIEYLPGSTLQIKVSAC
ncbi:MAG TPA: beta-ketoacyl synthase chain length factor [Pararobbsia sp.]|nr:beta-ketoacyl synthase chain length factor [Pararobbsia sp.]